VKRIAKDLAVLEVPDETCPLTLAADAAQQQAMSEQSLAAGPPSAQSRAPSLEPGGNGWGMSSQLPAQINDPAMTELDPEHVRIVVPWDVALRPHMRTACGAKGDAGGNYANVKAWVAAAKAHQYQMTVSFGRCARQPEYKNMPTVTQYKAAIKRFLDDGNLSGVRFFAAFNEPDSAGQPTSVAKAQARHNADTLIGAKRTAQYWATFDRLCDSSAYTCSVAAGDFVDGPEFAASYYNAYRHALTHAPTIWAFHAYYTGNTGDYRRFDRFRDGVRASDKIWLTEQGGIVNSVRFPNRTEAAAKAGADRLISDVVNRDDRITRFYYYSLWGDAGGFDSGLLQPGPVGGPHAKRPVFDDLKAKLNPSP